MKTESSQSSPDFQSIVDEFMEGFAFQVPYDGSNDFYNKELLNLRPYIERELKIIWDKYIQKLPSIDQNEIPQDIKKALRNRWELVTQSSPVVETPNQVGEVADPDLSNLNHWAAWELKSKLTPIEPLKEEWISVKERLPEPQHDCLFTNVNVKGFKTPPVSSGYYANDRFYSWGGNLEGLKATHWMPLPSPPKV